MGSEYRDYFREPVAKRSYAPAVKAIIAANVIGYFLFLILGRVANGGFDEAYRLVGFVPHEVLERHRWWQIMSYAFVHDVTPLHVLVNVVFLWIAGREIETVLGTRAFLTFYAVAVLSAALAYAGLAAAIDPARDRPLFGASAAVVGVLVLFALHYPRQDLPVLMISMPAWLVVLVVGVADAALVLTSRHAHRTAALAHVAGLICGLAWYRAYPRVTGFLHELEHRVEQHERDEARELEEQVDTVLRKINEVGIDNLSGEERALLDRASRHFRRQQQKS